MSLLLNKDIPDPQFEQQTLNTYHLEHHLIDNIQNLENQLLQENQQAAKAKQTSLLLCESETDNENSLIIQES